MRQVDVDCFTERVFAFLKVIESNTPGIPLPVVVRDKEGKIVWSSNQKGVVRDGLCFGKNSAVARVVRTMLEESSFTAQTIRRKLSKQMLQQGLRD